ncbi:protease inhibitor I42 family protein [Methanimicrococcus stummii]|uniref:protease inhibitor I42 family protein n=1 Tax=Methanimicrococcus stummii TaxID=3028294 RepID=UPI00292F8157|nr:protease inhibitor I42 family protein [Methanimicrococcus sp. Es2]
MKNLTKLLILTGLILAVALSGCLGSDDGGAETDNNTNVSVSHFYKNVTLAENDTVVKFDFTSNPTTGYGWAVTVNKTGILDEILIEATADDSDLVGAPIVQQFYYKAQAPGTVALNFKYERSFEEGTTVEDLTYVIQVYQNNTAEIVSVSSAAGNLLPLYKEAGLEKNGTVMKIMFAENPTTGYTWNITMTPTDVLHMSKDYIDTPVTDAVGAAGVHTWEFDTLKAGNVSVLFDHNRSFENASTTETAVFSLKANSDGTIEIRGISLDTQ